VFESITESLQNVFRRFGIGAHISESSIREGLREVRTALLSADVNYKVAKDFIDRVAEKAVGQDVIKSVRPGQQIVKVVYDELVQIMGPADSALAFSQKGPTIFMMVGLQGGGKTTSCAKLALYLQRKGKSPLLVAADVRRPAAVEQLKILSQDIQIPFFSAPTANPVAICERSVTFATENGSDTVILDTQGRLHIDEEMMAELRKIKDRVQPQEILFVADAMTGQDAVNSAREFNEQLEITGVVLTKLDGDTKGGAALSIRAVTGKPIKFIGVGEKLDKIEEFHPDRIASRILGMGDIVTLVEKAQEAVSDEEARKLEEKILKEKFTLADFLSQLQQIKKMGSLKDILAMIPGLGSHLKGIEVDDSEIVRIESVVQSMTPWERNSPEIVDGSRRLRIARGSGRSVREVNDLLKQFDAMREMMHDFKKKGFFGRMAGLKELTKTTAVPGMAAPKRQEVPYEKRLKAREERKRLRRHKKKGRR
jgi:signal recognition particle subunit SRP54